MRAWPEAGIKGRNRRKLPLHQGKATFSRARPRSSCNAEWFQGIINKSESNRRSGCEGEVGGGGELFVYGPLWRPETDPPNK